MSWQAYVDSSMVASGHVDKGAIYSIAGDSKWAGSAGFELSAPEIQEVISGLSGKPDKLYSEGLHVAGERFVLTKCEDRSLYARKGREGVVIVKTKMAILIAHYKDGMVAGNTATTVEQLADYLIKQGY
ncbi:putative profilin [Hyaloscypha variabilis]|uniref:Profilin n=1 Tax=Hyaloscypha variabilis (strain UAMH 11265 / GT02V1 / F) TaxID=1149755 RepID=A0A2J6S6Y4_HYAVF|nr:putative profilin [Hyaloscypha variabilis F]